MYGQEKNEKKPQAYRLTVSAAGSGSVAAIKDGVHAREASRDPSIAASFAGIMPEGAHTARALRLRARAFQPQLLSARGVVACASLASTATPSSRVYAFSSRWMEFEAKASMSLLVLFSSVRKAHFR